MTPEALARLQARAYRHMTPWRAQDFADLIGLSTTRLLTRPHGLLLARIVVDEAEILALATDPDHQRQGIARALLETFQGQAVAEGVTRVFLEVASRNQPAQAFYQALGYREAGRRRDYYADPAGGRDDAVLMTRALPADHAA
jgi:ribosomal-protein-alanine N-acetyltransferase